MGTQSTTDVRVVDATREHIPFIAWVMLTAFRSHLERGLWDYYIGASERECLRFLEAMADTPTRHWMHHANFIVAVVDGTPAAALCGYLEAECGGPAFPQGMAEANAALGRSDEDNAAGWQRAGSIALVVPEHVEGAWIIENVATKPEFRRRGLVDRLMGLIMERGRQRGAVTSDISVFIGNDSAQRAYEKAGYAAIAEKRHPDFEAVYKTPGVRTLRRTL